MRWSRAERRFGASLGLFALAVQLFLAFGHVHVGEIARDSVVASIADTKAQPAKSSPVRHPASDTDDFCAICAAIHLTSTSFVPQAPQLPVPLLSRKIEHSSRIATIFVAPQRTPFQSRAPPLA